MNPSFAQFHDAELNGIEHDRLSTTVKLVFALADNSRACLLFREVSGLRVVDYGTQNVVSRLLTSGEADSDFNSDDISRNVSWVYGTADGGHVIDENRLAGVVTAVASKKLLLFMLEPSWGAEVGIVARKLDFA